MKDQIGKTYDLILSNPPYIKPSVIRTLEEDVRCFEPMCALDGGEDGLSFYRTIVKKTGSMLEDHGMIFFEIGYDQKEDVMHLLQEEGFGCITCYEDLAGNPRVVSGQKN